MKREDGYYWIRILDIEGAEYWAIGEWSLDCWGITFVDEALKESEILEIDERRIERQPNK